MLNFMLVPNEHITAAAISIGVVERYQILWVYMDKQGYLALTGVFPTIRAP
ncbi:MAG: hypothetical protein R6U40_02790 [Desulfobacterales bacterium]